jgi:quercetin dioxygenase-like cupin family protein
MIRKHSEDVERIENKAPGFKGMFARYLWSKDDGCPNFAMRLMEFEPDGHTSYHSHLEEHEFLILEGNAGYVDAFKKEIQLKPGDTIYVPTEELHQIKNTGGGTMRLLCMVPILPGGDGKSPAPAGA